MAPFGSTSKPKEKNEAEIDRVQVERQHDECRTIFQEKCAAVAPLASASCVISETLMCRTKSLSRIRFAKLSDV